MTEFSYQLYCSRDFPPLADTLKMVADAGYTQVEGYGALYADPAAVAALRTALADNGLTMPTAHFSLDMLTNTPDRAVEIAQALGIRIVFCPHVAAPERPTDAAGWAAFGTQVAAAGKAIWDAGLRYGWHNHDFEFVALPDGQFPMDLILASDARLALELDVAWVVRGGQDPMDWIAKYKDRIVAAHLKDIAPMGEALDEDGWADLGHGTMDWPALMAALRATRAEYFVIEHDKPSDHQRFARRAIAAAKML